MYKSKHVFVITRSLRKYVYDMNINAELINWGRKLDNKINKVALLCFQIAWT